MPLLFISDIDAGDLNLIVRVPKHQHHSALVALVTNLETDPNTHTINPLTVIKVIIAFDV
jgi:hypothetical protein